ncbi:hypothetical protein T03_12008 [Trichinella britovi]|uniref:Uncharacterized protein n=2 Tax=Trichinella TaxID=6333 RepID=A0A0V1DIZ9_TRIBR|nr:hypothetical protein T05_15325 [Trichinella murrelli]KRX57597.1 hypothetical protein T09_13468 [Trichinella sp. T9]KRY61106.1 hypothetical protein T03_12008 [Trichinella britovi]KRZ94434.1 hypothetical protein T08_9235 [Trichinella sp. T8]
MAVYDDSNGSAPLLHLFLDPLWQLNGSDLSKACRQKPVKRWQLIAEARKWLTRIRTLTIIHLMVNYSPAAPGTMTSVNLTYIIIADSPWPLYKRGQTDNEMAYRQRLFYTDNTALLRLPA